MTWLPHVTVAAVVERAGRYLLVEEETDEGIRFNQPAGHWEPGERLVEAAVREAMEETAHPFTPTHLVGIYNWTRPRSDITYLRFAFGGSVGEALAGARLDTGILRAVWMSYDELLARHAQHRSPLVLRCVDDLRAGRRYSLDLLTDQEP